MDKEGDGEDSVSGTAFTKDPTRYILSLSLQLGAQGWGAHEAREVARAFCESTAMYEVEQQSSGRCEREADCTTGWDAGRSPG